MKLFYCSENFIDQIYPLDKYNFYVTNACLLMNDFMQYFS